MFLVVECCWYCADGTMAASIPYSLLKGIGFHRVVDVDVEFERKLLGSAFCLGNGTSSCLSSDGDAS